MSIRLLGCLCEVCLIGRKIHLTCGEILFRIGDQSDGMYLLRDGELTIFVKENDREISLAKVVKGGLVGEMALFDNKPRSASVRALIDSELTLISKDDFSRMIRQVPKWLTVLMSTLSLRLRSTNERLLRLESESSKVKIGLRAVPRVLRLIELTLYKEGRKIGRDWLVSKQAVQYSFDLFREDFSHDLEVLGASKIGLRCA